MEFDEIYEIDRTADFIVAGNFSRVALQFPDELLKNSTRVVRALRSKLRLLQGTVRDQSEDETVGEVRLFVMADATYSSCCVDEVGASHVDADCVVHYGHTCLSPTSVLPALFVFWKEAINFSGCAESLLNYASTKAKPMVVLYGLEFAHAISRISELATVSLGESCPASSSQIHFANVMTTVVDPQNDQQHSDVFLRPLDGHVDIHDEEVTTSCRYKIGGLVWSLPRGKTMEDYLLLWIGADDSAFANVVLTFSSYEIARYDGKEDCLVTDLSQQKRILKRRYYLVEKAKDANIVGILVGTLGVAGYLNVIHQMKDLVNAAGKKSYTLVMGRPNPAKLANFPECDVFIYVSCAQTALLDSKEFLAPVITPFEAMVAFNRGIQWTGEYVIEFQDLINSRIEIRNPSEEAHFSFIQGRYMEDTSLQEDEKEDGVLALVTAAEKALQLRERNSSWLTKGTVKSGAEYLANRSYQGLEIHHDESMPEPYFIGRTGKASGYDHEKNKA